MKRSELFFSVIQLPLDFLMIVLAGIAAYFLRFTPWAKGLKPILFNLPFSEYLPLVLIVALAWVVIFALAGLYRLKVTRGLGEEISLVIISCTAGFAGIAIYIFMTRELFESRFIVLVGWVLATIFVSLGRLFIRRLQKFLVSRFGLGIRRVLLIGKENPDQTQKIIETISQNPSLGYQVTAKLSRPRLATIEQLAKEDRIDEVFLASLEYDREQILELIALCHRQQLDFKFVTDLFYRFQTEARLLGTLPLVRVRNTPLEGWGRIVKRLFDIFFSFWGLVVLSPFFALVGLAIKWDSAGPVFVRLKRVREGGKIFYLYKFRSMIRDAHKYKKFLLAHSERKGPLFKLKDDPRITRVGRFLRRFRIDEFAQLINVLKGEMSLVGPRPHEPEEVALYKKYQKRLLSIKPGITGLAQVSGASNLPFEKEVRLDIFYIEHWSLWLDLKILAKTFARMWQDPSAI